MFPSIARISDIAPVVANKKEIRFLLQPNGITLGCYLFMDTNTFDTPEALECRGIAFDQSGAIVSRPLHKFFNAGEKEWLLRESLLAREDIAGVYEKIDGSMIATAWFDGKLQWRSKKAFESAVVKLARQHLEEHPAITQFASKVAARGWTASFELTHPDARIVVAQETPAFRLLHVRDNVSGEYLMLDPKHEIHSLIAEHGIPTAPRFPGMSMAAAIDSLTDMRDREGYVVQFTNGDMVKIKCPWYLRLHRSISFLRERDIATLALNEELDDVKGALVEVGIDLTAVNAVEAKLKAILTGLLDQIEQIYESGKTLDRKSFAIANSKHELFALAMQRYLGREVPLVEWYTRNRLKQDFGLDSLTSEAVSEALEG